MTTTHNHLVCKRTINHLAKLASLAKWLGVRLRTKWLWVIPNPVVVTLYYLLSFFLSKGSIKEVYQAKEYFNSVQLL